MKPYFENTAKGNDAQTAAGKGGKGEREEAPRGEIPYRYIFTESRKVFSGKLIIFL